MMSFFEFTVLVLVHVASSGWAGLPGNLKEVYTITTFSCKSGLKDSCHILMYPV